MTFSCRLFFRQWAMMALQETRTGTAHRWCANSPASTVSYDCYATSSPCGQICSTLSAECLTADIRMIPNQRHADAKAGSRLNTGALLSGLPKHTGHALQNVSRSSRIETSGHTFAGPLSPIPHLQLNLLPASTL